MSVVPLVLSPRFSIQVHPLSRQGVAELSETRYSQSQVCPSRTHVGRRDWSPVLTLPEGRSESGCLPNADRDPRHATSQEDIACTPRADLQDCEARTADFLRGTSLP